MSLLFGVDEAVKPFLERGAIAVYVALKGNEILFMGNESFKNMLATLIEFRGLLIRSIDNGLLDQLRMTLPMRLKDVPSAHFIFELSDMKAIVAWRGGLVLALIFPFSKTDFGFDEINKSLSLIEKSINIDNNFNPDLYLQRIKILFLQARKSVSYGDKESLIRNLREIRELLVSSGNPALLKYPEIIEGLISAIENRKLSDDVRLKIKRSLLSIFKNISKQLENT